MLNFRSTPQEHFQNYFFALTRHIKTYPISDNTYDKITAIFLKSPDNHVVMKKKKFRLNKRTLTETVVTSCLR